MVLNEIIKKQEQNLIKELKVECKKEFIVDLNNNKLSLEKFTDFDENGNKIHEFTPTHKISYHYNSDNLLVACISVDENEKLIFTYNYDNNNQLEHVYLNGKKNTVLDIENRIKHTYYNDPDVNIITNKYNKDWLLIEEIRYDNIGREYITYYKYDNNKNLIRTKNESTDVEYGYDRLNRLIYKKVRNNEKESNDINIQYHNNMILIYNTAINDNNQSNTRTEIKIDDNGLVSEISVYGLGNKLQEKTVYSYEFYK